MSKTKIEWCDYSVNPVKGLCPMACSYCYARRMYKRFKWSPEIRLDLDVFQSLYRIKEPSRIFVGSTMELFGDFIDSICLKRIFQIIRIFPQHTFIFLTKRPQNLINWSPFPNNCWVGASVTDKLTYADALHHLMKIGASKIFLSIEPLLRWDDCLPKADGERMLDSGIDWVIIGQCTPARASTMPGIEWIQEIIQAADRANIPVFLKNNLKGFLPFRQYFKGGDNWKDVYNLRQEFPK